MWCGALLVIVAPKIVRVGIRARHPRLNARQRQYLLFFETLCLMNSLPPYRSTVRPLSMTISAVYMYPFDKRNWMNNSCYWSQWMVNSSTYTVRGALHCFRSVELKDQQNHIDCFQCFTACDCFFIRNCCDFLLVIKFSFRFDGVFSSIICSANFNGYALLHVRLCLSENGLQSNVL